MKKFLLSFFCVMILQVVYGNRSFLHYSVNQGLSSNAIHAMVQDVDGYLWFGTKDGLNRFDGYTFKVFRITDFIQQEYITSNSNYIRSMLEQPDSAQIWVGTESGVFIFDKKRQAFVDFRPKEDGGLRISQTVSSMIEDKGGNIWIASSGQGIFKYEKASGRLRLYRRAKPGETSPGTIITDHSWALCVDDYDIVWASTFKSGICSYEPKEDRFVFHAMDTANTMKIFSTCYDTQEKCIWIGTLVNGLYKYDVKNYTWKKIDTRIHGQEIDLMHCFSKISLHEMLIGSKSGLLRFNLVTSQCGLVEEPTEPSDLNLLTVTSLCMDREGGIWLGTEYNGIYYLLPQLDAVHHYYMPNASNPTAMGKVISDFVPGRTVRFG